MKKTIALLLSVCTVLCLVACSDANDIPTGNNTSSDSNAASDNNTSSADTPTKTPLRCLENVSYNYSDVGIVDRIGTPEAQNVSLDVPVYYEDELFYRFESSVRYFKLSYDAYFYIRNHFYEEMMMIKILAHFPTNALRLRADGSYYIVYDTDTGYRLYLFSEANMAVGFPVVIKKNGMLSMCDFRDIKIGDPIEKLEQIDDVATFHKKQLLFGISPGTFVGMAERGTPYSSVHYLKDGILKFEYTMTEERKIFISNIIFYEDFAIKTGDGVMTNHKIKDIDLPVA